MKEAKILLIEDDPGLVYLIQRYAERANCHLIHSESWEQLPDLAQSEQPGLILLDVSLPDNADQTILRRLAEQPDIRRIPIFACSSSEVALENLKEEVDGILIKPIMYTDFLATLRQAGIHLSADVLDPTDADLSPVMSSDSSSI